MVIEALYNIYKKTPLVCTDTRMIKPGAIFFALKGDVYDGNEFAEKAIWDGCSYAVVDEPRVVKSSKFILVGNVLETLQELARHHRKQFNIPFIGITGSNGKTTTKELVQAVLKKRYQVFATRGNLNNHIGVPLSILSIPLTTEIAIIEMGANHQKEIEFLCGIARPNYGLITNIGKAHLEGFGGVEGIKKGKGELYDYIRENGGKIFLDENSEVLLEMAGSIPAITYGIPESCYTQGTFFDADPYVRLEWSCSTRDISSQLVQSSIVGKYNFPNLLAAICIGNFFDVGPNSINEAIQSYVPDNNRSQVLKTDRNILLLDAYNANPSSMEEAINNFYEMKAEKKVLVLGDMLELGEESEQEHQKIVELARSRGFENVYLVGLNFMKTECPYQKYDSIENLRNHLLQEGIIGAAILIKGSRGIKLEMISDVF